MTNLNRAVVALKLFIAYVVFCAKKESLSSNRKLFEVEELESRPDQYSNFKIQSSINKVRIYENGLSSVTI